jgi:hypothetical protein
VDLFGENVGVTLRKNINNKIFLAKQTVAYVVKKYLVLCNSRVFKGLYLKSIQDQLIPCIKLGFESGKNLYSNRLGRQIHPS